MRDMVRFKRPELPFYSKALSMGIYLYIFVQLCYDTDENHIHDFPYSTQLLQNWSTVAVVIFYTDNFIYPCIFFLSSQHISISPMSRKKHVNCYPKKL